MQTMSKRIPVLALLGLVAAGAAGAATLKETFQKSYPLNGGEVTLANVNGWARVEAWDKNEVQVVAEKQVKAGSDQEAKRLLGQVKIEVAKTAQGLRIETKMPKKKSSGFFDWIIGNNVNASVNYKLRVPRRIALQMGTVNGGLTLIGTRGRASLTTTNGGIEITRVDGNLSLSTTNGGLLVTDSAGAVKASTTNGSIKAELRNVPNGSDLAFSTTNGSVTVRLPQTIRVSLDAATVNGRVSSDFSVAGGDAKPSRRRLAGDINGGGGTLKVRSTNGSVDISSL